MITRKVWEKDVVKLLNRLYSQGSLVERYEIGRLLSDYDKLEAKAELSRKSKEKRAMMQKLQGTEMVRVKKRDNERLKEILTEAVALI